MAKRKRRRRLKKGPKIILLLIVLLVVGGIYLYTHSKKYLFLKGLDKSYDEIMNVTNTFIDNYMPYTNGGYYNNMDSSIKVVTSEIDSTIDFDGGIYMSNSSNYFDLDITTNGTEYGLEMLSKDQKLHFKIDDSKYYYTSYNNVNLSNDNYSKLLSIFVDNLKDNIKSNNLEKENAKVMINSKNYNTKKITLHIDSELYQKTMKDFYSDIKNDTDMLDILLSLTEFSSREELIKYLESDNITLNSDVYLSIYLYKSSPIKMEIGYGFKQSISLISYDEYVEINAGVEDSLSYLKFDNKKVDLFIDGIGYGTGTYDDKSFEIDFTDYNKNSIGNVSYSINKNSNKYFNKIIFNLDLSDIDIGVDLSNQIEMDKKVPSINVNDSVIVDNMLEKDKKALSELLSTINLIFTF